MSSAGLNYATNLLRLLRGDRLLRPLVAIYYLTTQCNLRCAYCEDFGRERQSPPLPPLPLEEALRVLRVLRGGVDHLILTGGESLLHPDIDELVLRARQEVGFRHLTLLTNGLALPRHEALLPAVDRLEVSLDAVDPARWGPILGVSPATAQDILDNIAHYAGRQREFGYRMVANCVVSPETLPGARQVLDWVGQHGLLVSFSPQATNNWPRYELLVDPDYRAFWAGVMAAKRRGAPVLGSMAYARALLELQPYSCYPALIPRVLPNGDLIYPCWPIEKAGTSHGGRPCNLLEVRSWAEAQRLAAAAYGVPPRLCTSCWQQCYAEPSLMQARPLSFLGEWLRYRASRRGGVATFAPG